MQLIRLDDGTHVWVQRITRPAGGPLDALDKDVALQVEDAVRKLVLKDTARRPGSWSLVHGTRTTDRGPWTDRGPRTKDGDLVS